MHISIATEQITVQKSTQKVTFKMPPEFGFFCPDPYAVPVVRGTTLPLLPRQCLPQGLIVVFHLISATEEDE